MRHARAEAAYLCRGWQTFKALVVELTLLQDGDICLRLCEDVKLIRASWSNIGDLQLVAVDYAQKFVFWSQIFDKFNDFAGVPIR